jgi:hypothetical protein
MREVLELGRECGLIYGLLWESAFKDVRLHERFPENRKLAMGGCSSWSVKGIHKACHLGKDTVRRGLKKLMEAGFIQYAGEVRGKEGTWKRWRVTHPSELDAVRYAIEVMGGPVRPPLEDRAPSVDIDGNVWFQTEEEAEEHEALLNASREAEEALRPS